jgi:hypothetical protein
MTPITSTTFRDTPYWLNFVFAGQTFNMSHIYSSVAAGASVYCQASTDSRLAHLVRLGASVQGGGPVVGYLIEAPAFTAGTTPPTVYANMDRRSAKTPTMVMYTNPTGVSGGVTIDMTLIPTGGGVLETGAGSIAIEALEWVFRPATTYIIRLHNQGTSASTINLNMVWYESSN